MATISNPTVRTFNLPARGGFGAGLTLHPGARLTVPDTYAEALLAETNSKGKPTGWALRLVHEGKSAFTVRHPKGAAGLFEQKILALRREKAQAEEKARTEAQAAEDARKDAADAKAKLVTMEQRLADLEAQLARANAPKGEPPKDDKPKK